MGNTNSIAEQDAEDDLRELLIATGLREPTGRPSRDPQPSDQAAVPWASMPPYGYAPVTQSAMLPYQMPSAYPSYFTPPSILPPPSYPAIGWNAPPPMPGGWPVTPSLPVAYYNLTPYNAGMPYIASSSPYGLLGAPTHFPMTLPPSPYTTFAPSPLTTFPTAPVRMRSPSPPPVIPPLPETYTQSSSPRSILSEIPAVENHSRASPWRTSEPVSSELAMPQISAFPQPEKPRHMLASQPSFDSEISIFIPPHPSYFRDSPVHHATSTTNASVHSAVPFHRLHEEAPAESVSATDLIVEEATRCDTPDNSRIAERGRAEEMSLSIVTLQSDDSLLLRTVGLRPIVDAESSDNNSALTEIIVDSPPSTASNPHDMDVRYRRVRFSPLAGNSLDDSGVSDYASETSDDVSPPVTQEQVDDPAETDEDGFDSVPGSLLSFRTWPPVSSGARRRLRPTYRMMRALERGVYPGNALGISLEDGTSMLSQYASDTSELYAEDIRYGNMNPRPEVGSQSSAETIRVIPSTPQLSSSSTQFSPVIPPRPPPSSSATAYTSLSMPSSPQGSEAESMASPAASSTMTDQESPSPAGPLHASLTAMTGFVIGKRFRKMFRTQPSAKPTSENEALPHRSTSSSKMDRQIGICRGRKSDILALDSSWDDARLFVELGKSYDKLRAWRKWLSLRGLKSITLVVDADIEKIIYPYRVGPTKVTAHRNMRLRWYLEHPEKLKDKDEFVRIVTQHPGLGIEFVERWQPSRITIVIATLVTLSLVVALAYSEVTGDIVTGFTVAAYMTSAYSVCLVLVGVMNLVDF